MEKVFHATDNQKRAKVIILMSDKIDFLSKSITKEGHCIVIKGSIHQGAVTIVNIHVSNIGAPKYLKQMLIELQYNNSRGLQHPTFNIR